MLEVVGEGWGAFAGYTVVDPESGEHVEIPTDAETAVGRLEYNEHSDPDHPLGPYLVAVSAQALSRFNWTKAERVDHARQLLAHAERGELAPA